MCLYTEKSPGLMRTVSPVVLNSCIIFAEIVTAVCQHYQLNCHIHGWGRTAALCLRTVYRRFKNDRKKIVFVNCWLNTDIFQSNSAVRLLHVHNVITVSQYIEVQYKFVKLFSANVSIKKCSHYQKICIFCKTKKTF